jgi:hypothetical protein
MIIDDILTKLNLKYEDLTIAEKDTLNGWMAALSKNAVTIETVRGHIAAMRDAVEQELTKSDLNTKQDLFLKARLRNYMLLEAYLTTPDKAKKAMEQMLAGIGKRG